ncbi:MAG: hypothetical protein M1133_12770 [Armatimonadetes bacterium]|nr:hypothetical protein [Armatimonadota bacterium]
MLKRTLFILIALCLPASICFAQAGVGAEKTGPVVYRDFGFRVNIPEPYQKHTLPASGDTLVSDVYISGDYAYLVKVTKTPANSISSTAIEQAIQAEAKSAPSKRWEQDSAHKDLFKGVTRAYEFDAAAQMQYPFLEKICKGKECIQTISMTPLKDESSPIITVGVIGPKTPGNEVEVKAKDIAFTLTKLTATLAPTARSQPEPKLPTAPQVKPGQAAPAPMPPGMRRQPVPTPTPIPSAPTHPTTATPEPRPFVRNIPATPAAKPATAIKKGDIALLGSVRSIAPNRKSLTMLVEQVTLPGMSPIPLNPARQKTVCFSKLAGGISTGSKIKVVGKNKGVGKPINADVLEPAH